VLEQVKPTGEYGTTVEAVLDPESGITLDKAQSYLTLYVQYLPVKVEFNGAVISQKPMSEQYRDDAAKIQAELKHYEAMGGKADVLVQCNDAGRVSCSLNNIYLSGQSVNGSVYLRQDAGHLWGLRSSFGLSPIPLSSYYSFGGVVDLSILSPTAGREALTRESIELASRLLQLAEECSTHTLSSSEICNRNTPFMSHILATNRVNLADKLVIKALPDREMTLGELKEQSKKQKFYYYEGNDESIMKAYATPDTPLIILSRSNPRRQLESLFIQRFCSMEKVADIPKILKIYEEQKYEMNELSFVIKAKNILEDDYAIDSVVIRLAELTHNLPYIVKSPTQGAVEIFIQRNHATIQPILRCYSEAYDCFPGFIKDFIRVHIYPQVRNRVPSSTKEGAEALQKTLRQKRELYEIKAEDVAMTSLFSDFMAGKIGFQEVVRTANAFQKSQTQEITQSSIGTMESEIPDLVSSPIQPPKNDQGPELRPSPPIVRTDLETDKKLLLSEKKLSSLNDFQVFLAISDRAFAEEYDFFLSPHTTRIIWGGRRIIFIFTHASERFSLYYDVEILEDTGKVTGGGVFPTTTILTKRRIFIPVPENLKQFFELEEGKRKFYVRFDTISSY
jgi:molecular chaperone HtpG